MGYKGSIKCGLDIKNKLIFTLFTFPQNIIKIFPGLWESNNQHPKTQHGEIVGVVILALSMLAQSDFNPCQIYSKKLYEHGNKRFFL